MFGVVARIRTWRTQPRSATYPNLKAVCDLRGVGHMGFLARGLAQPSVWDLSVWDLSVCDFKVCDLSVWDFKVWDLRVCDLRVWDIGVLLARLGASRRCRTRAGEA
jgi:hypothetical protein